MAIGALKVEIVVALCVHIGHEGHIVVANHASRLVACQLPLWHYSQLVALADKAANVGFIARGVDDADERMQSAVSVP